MLPPLHKVDGPIEFVHIADWAWDKAKVDAECDQMSADEKAEHPFYAYHLGETRYDLSQVREYLKDGEPPCVFTLKRLSYDQWRTCKTFISRGAKEAANDYALVHGLTAARLGDNELQLKGPDSDKRRLTDGDLKRLIDTIGYEMLQEIGEAVRSASGDLTSAEKKP